jgi:tRNA(adenine34) deaminase
VNDFEYMHLAIAQAQSAALRGEVPIGAVIVLEDRILAAAGNRTITDCDPTAHAEIDALRDAAKALGNYRLLGASLYVTIEPCAMCAGAMIQARIGRLIYGADDAKAGAVRSCFSIFEHPSLNHRVQVTPGFCAEESAALLRDFFVARR